MEKASVKQERYVSNKCFGSCLALCTNCYDMWTRENKANKKTNKQNKQEQYKTVTKTKD